MTKLHDSPPNLVFSIHYHQARDLTESKIYQPWTPMSKKKPPQYVCCIFFEKKRCRIYKCSSYFYLPTIIITLILLIDTTNM